MSEVEVDLRHRAYEIAQKINEGGITRQDYLDTPRLILETSSCLEHLHDALGNAEGELVAAERSFEILESENLALKNWCSSLEYTIKTQEADIEYYKDLAEGKDYVPTILLKESERQLDKANEKIAEQAQELVSARKTIRLMPVLEAELKRANERLSASERCLKEHREREQGHDDLSALAEREAGRIDKFQVSEFQVSHLVSENASLLQTVDDLRDENRRLKAAGEYLKKPRRSYLMGVVSAAGDVVRLVVGGRT